MRVASLARAALLVGLGVVTGGGPPLAGQEPPPEAVLRGTVWDSLSGGPLAGAEVRVGDVAVARADDEGRFALRAPAGSWPVSFAHPALSDWGALRHPVTLRLEEGRTVSVALATASASTVLDRLCGGGAAVVGGVVRDLLTLVPLAGASVRVQVVEGPGEGPATLTTAGDGGWSACLAPGARVEVEPRLGDVRGRAVRVGGDAAVAFRDLYLQASRPAELQGQVLDGTTGEPLVDAEVEVVGSRLRTLTASDGRFRFRGVPPGVVRMAVGRLGYGRRVALVRAEGGSTARVTVELFAEALAVDSVVVTVEGGVVDRDRLPTRFDGLTRSQIDALLPRTHAFDGLLRNANIPGLRVREVEYVSESGVRRPGICVETARRSGMSSESCEMVEVYLNDVRVADAELLLQTLDPGSIDRIQLLSPTQAGIRYLGTPRARNGILLVWTRRR